MTPEVLPDIPRGFTAFAEWSACLVYILLLRKRFTPPVLGLALGLGLGLLWSVQIFAGKMPIALWTLGMAMAVAAMYAVVALCADVSTREVGYFTARAFVLAELVASFHWQLYSYAVDQGFTGLTVQIGLLVLVYGAAFTGAYLIERRHFPPDQRLEIDRRGLLSAVAIAGVTFLMSNVSFVSSNTPFSGRFPFEIFYIRTLVDLAGYVALYAHQGQRLELQRAVEVEAMNRMLRSQHEQYLQSKRNIDIVNRKYHDLKHFVTAIRTENDPEAKATYLDRLEESIRGYGAQVQTGNPVLDTILTAKTAQCAELGITLTCVVDGAALSFMDAMGLSALFGNALDNAIESTAPLPDPDNRLVRVAVYTQGALVMVRFENYHVGDLEFDDGIPRTTKRDALNHGYGLRNMRQVVEGHGGSLTIHDEADWFVVRALIPVPAERRSRALAQDVDALGPPAAGY
ncbi:sensor histidine kinase [Oerskovia sp. Sa1BUA8]|uniref:Sensor histidine kinase n=1 Tax=Oerskovia douganii TaxID=2762210 RepID=A0A9D5UCB4_9CELL|nr:ATP-binding protein [Oerskovia douganii]MBE7702330.1 sensor histidine kinase [Oerskovia douganii]